MHNHFKIVKKKQFKNIFLNLINQISPPCHIFFNKIIFLFNFFLFLFYGTYSATITFSYFFFYFHYFLSLCHSVTVQKGFDNVTFLFIIVKFKRKAFCLHQNLLKKYKINVMLNNHPKRINVVQEL